MKKLCGILVITLGVVATVPLQPQAAQATPNVRKACFGDYNSLNGFLNFWKDKWPHRDVTRPDHEQMLRQDCHAAIKNDYMSDAAGKIQEAARLQFEEAPKQPVVGDQKIAAGKKAIEDAKTMEEQARELIRAGNAIKARGNKKYETGYPDEAAAIIKDGQARMDRGNEELKNIQKKKDEGAALIAEGEKLKTTGQAALLAQAQNFNAEADTKFKTAAELFVEAETGACCGNDPATNGGRAAQLRSMAGNPTNYRNSVRTEAHNRFNAWLAQQQTATVAPL